MYTSTKKGTRASPLFIGVSLFLSVILVFLVFEGLENRRFQEELKTSVFYQISTIKNNLEKKINNDFHITRGLISYIALNPDLDQITFNKIASDLIGNRPSIRNIGIAPQNIIKHVYPISGNEAAIGLNYELLKNQWPAVKRAIDERKTVVAGPVDLVQGGGGFIVRTPVYVHSETHPDNNQYWGLVSVVVDRDSLLGGISPDRDNVNIRVALRGQGGLGEKGAVFYGDSSIFTHAPIMMDIALPEGSWQVAAMPLDGWEQSSPNIKIIRWLGFLLAVLLSLGAFWGRKRTFLNQARLESALANEKKVVEDFKDSEQRYRNIVENTEDLITRVDSNGKLLYVNSASRIYWGLSPDECVGRMAFDFILPEDRPFTEQSFQSWINSKKGSIAFENRQLHVSGKTTTLLWTISSVRNEQGELVEFTNIARNIEKIRLEERLQKALLVLIEYTERHTVQQLLQEFLSHAEELTESCIGFYHFVDEESGQLSLQAWSKNTLNTFCTADGDSLHYPVSEAGVWADSLHQRKPVIHNDYGSLPHKKGLPEGHATISRELVVPVFRADKIVAILGVGNKPHEYTEIDVQIVQKLADLAWEIIVRKQTEEALRESEEHHRLLYIETPAMMHSINKNGAILNVSKRWLKNMGYDIDEVIGHQSTEFLTEESCCYAKEVVLPQFFEKGVVTDVQYNFVKKNGEIMQTLLSATAEYDDGQFLRSLAVIVDVTERNKLLAEQTRSAQLAALGTVAAGVAHEINNPIQGILNYATLLKNKPDQRDRTVDLAKRIIHESERISEITKDLLDFSRDDRNNKVLSDIRALIESAIDLIEKKTIRQGISIETNCSEDLQKVMLYPQGIQQVVINLIDNASDALQFKEMPIVEKVIKVCCYKVKTNDGDMIFLEVSDRGVGMTKDVLVQAKDSFFSTKPSSRGTGLGLSIVNDIINRHNGHMEIESVYGEYTKIQIYLPATEQLS